VCASSDLLEEVPDALELLDDFGATHLRLAVAAVDEGDRDLADRLLVLARAHNDLHLEHLAARLDFRHDRLERVALLEAEGAREVRGARREEEGREEVGAARDELALEVPALHAAAARLARARDDVKVPLLLLRDELGDELGLRRRGMGGRGGQSGERGAGAERKMHAMGKSSRRSPPQFPQS
jgi:hypothetical protein